VDVRATSFDAQPPGMSWAHYFRGAFGRGLKR